MDSEDTLTASLKGPWVVIGLMSGTSLDGLDVAVCEFDVNTDFSNWRGEITYYQCFKYPSDLSLRLRESMSMTSEKLFQLDRDWARFAASCVNTLNTKAHLLSSHGHTVFHNPSDGYTVQIGSGADLAALTSLPVVCDLRRLDVAYGGQGAPLVPFADRMLFSEYSGCLNLGGFSNISFFDHDGNTQAFDVGPCNNLLNWLTSEINLDYDDGGEIATQGKVIDELLTQLLSLSFHKLPPPKSLGMEWINKALFPILDNWKHVTLEDRLRTSVEYIAKIIFDVTPTKGNVLITGGGAYNTFLIHRLHEMAKDRMKCNYVLPDDIMIQGKEAYAFAFLGLMRWLKEPNILTSVSGAVKTSSGGAVWLP